jgi:cation diffusion facilitator family transporter
MQTASIVGRYPTLHLEHFSNSPKFSKRGILSEGLRDAAAGKSYSSAEGTPPVIASSGLAALKFAVGLLTGSLGLIAEAAHSLLDLVSTLITLLVVRVAAIPPDRDHPYGHEKAENLGALAGMALLAATAAFILYHAITKIFVHPIAPNVTIWSFAVLIISIGVDLSRARALRKAAKKHHSDALASDAEHFWNDMLGAMAVLAGSAIVAVSRAVPVPEWLTVRADAFAAAIVACIALRSVWRAQRQSHPRINGQHPSGFNRSAKGAGRERSWGG